MTAGVHVELLDVDGDFCLHLVAALSTARGWCRLMRLTPLMLFSAMMVVQFFIVLSFYPETKRVSLEQMQHRLGIE